MKQILLLLIVLVTGSCTNYSDVMSSQEEIAMAAYSTGWYHGYTIGVANGSGHVPSFDSVVMKHNLDSIKYQTNVFSNIP